MSFESSTCLRTTSELSKKYSTIKQVPWFSFAEWYDVYKQIYSNDTVEQTKAYETLLAWKARMPKLPVGVEGTLAILQVCLRDREWTSMIDNGKLPMYYENDLSLMYSTMIMRILNHLTAVGQTKQTSLFQVAKELNIPSWIVSLRHNAAHGQELAPLGVLRIAINILLEWLHEEYWAVEADIQQYYVEHTEAFEEDFEETTLRDLAELWTSVNLYIHVGYQLASQIPDKGLWSTLQNLDKEKENLNNSKDSDSDENVIVSANSTEDMKSNKECDLKVARTLLLSKINAYIYKDKYIFTRGNIFCDMLCENKAFLPDSTIMSIFKQEEKNKTSLKTKFVPSKMLYFWKDIITLLYKKKILGMLIFKLLAIVSEERESKERKAIAALWINTIIHSFVQLDIAQAIFRTMECKSSVKNITLSTKDLVQRVKKRIYSRYPYFRNTLWLDISGTIPRFLLNMNFVSKLLLHVKEFSMELTQALFKLVTPKINAQTEKHLLKLYAIYTFQKYDKDDSKNICEKIFTVDDLRVNRLENEIQAHKEKSNEEKIHLADRSIRNSHWQLASDTYQWGKYPIGLLPWQDSMKSLELLELSPQKHIISVLESKVIPGTVNIKNLKMESRIDWDRVLWNRRRKKRKRDEDEAVIIDTALEVAKKQK